MPKSRIPKHIKTLDSYFQELSNFEKREIHLLDQMEIEIEKIRKKYNKEIEQCKNDRDNCEKEIVYLALNEYNEEIRESIIEHSQGLGLSQEKVKRVTLIHKEWNQDTLDMNKIYDVVDLDKSIYIMNDRQKKSENLFEKLHNLFSEGGGD